MKKFTKGMAKRFEAAIKAWDCDDTIGDYVAMKKIYAEDRNQLKSILKLMIEGEFGIAKSYANHLDTIVRDQIPNNVWGLLMETK
jgi:hypothetical protein